jgi:hypothetical protein
MSRAEMKVTELVDKIEREELQLPAMQRQYVWKATKVRDLLDSLYRGYPSGAILMWESFDDIATRDFAVSSKSGAVARPLLLLDGQQRLTSLSAVIRGEPIQNGKRKRTVDILFNLDHPDELVPASAISSEEEDLDEEADEDELEEDNVQTRLKQRTFTVSSRALASLPNWVSVSEIFKNEDVTPILQRAGVEDFKDPRYKKYVARLQNLKAIKDYVYRVDVLEATMSYDEVTEIFVRVNSLGMQLKSSDLALAQITARWKDSLEVFTLFQEQCLETSGFDFELGIYVRALVVFATGQSRFKTISSLKKDELEAAWKRTVRGVEYALNFLKSNCKVDSRALMSSPYFLHTISFWIETQNYKVTKAQERDMVKWFHVANTKARYSRGSSETILDQDLTVIRNGGGPAEMLGLLKTQVGRLDLTLEELEGKSTRSSVFKTMFLAFREVDATDWETHLAISPSHSGVSDRIQFHHIFPKAYLKRKAPELVTRQVDDIANLAFIGGRTNLKITDKAPKDYLASIVNSDTKVELEKQCIPTDIKLYEVENFGLFMEERRKLLLNRLNEFLDIS